MFTTFLSSTTSQTAGDFLCFCTFRPSPGVLDYAIAFLVRSCPSWSSLPSSFLLSFVSPVVTVVFPSQVLAADAGLMIP
jgi:hypothetical protein